MPSCWASTNEAAAREIVLGVLAEEFADMPVGPLMRLTRRIVDCLAEVQLIAEDD